MNQNKINEPEFDPQPITEPTISEEQQTEMPKEALGEQRAPDPNQEDKETRSRRLPTVVAMENKYLQATDLDGRYRLAQAFFKSGMVPKGYKDAASVFAGMELANELGLKPFTALKNIAVINGSPAIWGDLPLALVRRSGKMDKITEIIFDKEYNRICFDNKNLGAEVYGALCRTWNKENEDYHETVFTMDDARKAGLVPGKAESAWFKYPKRMLQMRARTQNLKDQFGDVLLGIEVAEYDYNYIPQRDVTPDGTVNRNGDVVKDNAAELNKTLEKH